MARRRDELREPKEVLYRIKRGLAGYVSYLAACEMNESFSEYLLYEPMLRILSAHGYTVNCEVVCPGIPQPATGDKKKLDFVARYQDVTLAIEVKWAKRSKPKIDSDMAKLRACKTAEPNWRAFLCVFGTQSCILNLTMPSELTQSGECVIADLGRTKFGCRIYELAEQNKSSVRAGGRC